MSLHDVTGIPAVSLQTESAFPKEHVIDILKNRFSLIYLLYDNDFDKEINWGREFGSKLRDKFKFLQIEIPEEYKSKDFSDLVKNHGEKNAKECIEELIDQALPF
jgi:hypothetical protein